MKLSVDDRGFLLIIDAVLHTRFLDRRDTLLPPTIRRLLRQPRQ